MKALFSRVRHPSHPGRGHGSLTCHMTQFEPSDWLRSENFTNIMIELFTQDTTLLILLKHTITSGWKEIHLGTHVILKDIDMVSKVVIQRWWIMQNSLVYGINCNNVFFYSLEDHYLLYFGMELLITSFLPVTGASSRVSVMFLIIGLPTVTICRYHLSRAKKCRGYPKKYAHGFCFAVLCCGYTLTEFPISIRLTLLALWQSNDCPSASKATLMNMDKYSMRIHYERLHDHNKAKHSKTVCIFLGIYCTQWHHLHQICRTEKELNWTKGFIWSKIFHTWCLLLNLFGPCSESTYEKT